MVRTASVMLPLGTTAPDFQLPDVDGKPVARDDFRGKKGLLVIFMCKSLSLRKACRSRTCPYR